MSLQLRGDGGTYQCKYSNNESGAYTTVIDGRPPLAWDINCDATSLPSKVSDEYNARPSASVEINVRKGARGPRTVRVQRDGKGTEWSVTRRYVVANPMFTDTSTLEGVSSFEAFKTPSSVLASAPSMASLLKKMWMFNDKDEVITNHLKINAETVVKIHYYVRNSIKSIVQSNTQREAKKYTASSNQFTMYAETKINKVTFTPVIMNDAVRNEFVFDPPEPTFLPTGELLKEAHVADIFKDAPYAMVYRNGDVRAIVTFTFVDEGKEQVRPGSTIRLKNLACSAGGDVACVSHLLSELEEFGRCVGSFDMCADVDVSFECAAGSSAQDRIAGVLETCKKRHGGPFTYSSCGFGWEGSRPAFDLKNCRVKMYRSIK